MLELFRKNIFFIVIGAVIIIFFIMTMDDSETNAHKDLTPIPVETGEETENIPNQEPDKIIVDIKGEVNKPGVYELAADSRVQDVVLLAGGFLDNADQTVINLAQKVHDEMIIIVPSIGDQGAVLGGKTSNGKVRINYATVEEIQSLNGIGPAKAQAIIQHRDEFGYFKKIEDLLDVSGIGEKTLENIQEDIQIP